MRKKTILITGAVGEIGQALIQELSGKSSIQLLTLDLNPLPANLSSEVTHVEGDIYDDSLLARLVSEFEFTVIYHLAALLSTRAEFTPALAHRVNVGGTMKLLQLAAEQSEHRDESVRFIFPSSIAAYGVPDLQVKARDEYVREWEWNNPTTMYGCNKLYCELLGTYYSQYFRQLAARRNAMLDFRSLQFPGLISSFTLPSGATSDYAPEMIHAAANGETYDCFVREDTRIPFMAMPDAVKALLKVADAPSGNLQRRVYNVTSFSMTAADIRSLVLEAIPSADIRFSPDVKRQGIIDSWPADLDDNAARKDWGWQPEYDLNRTFSEYLLPNIFSRYQS